MDDKIRYSIRGFIVAACFALGILTTIATGGGGGGGTVTPPPPPPASDMVPITSDNAEDVATTLIIGIGLSFDVGDISGGGVNVPAAAGAPGVLRLMRADDLVSKPLANNSAKLEGCANSGSVDVTATLADPNTLTVGDRIVGVFQDCDDGEGYVISGTVDLTVSAVDGDFMTDVFLLGFDVLLTDVEITEGGEIVSVQGDFTLTIDSLNFPVLSQTIEGWELSIGSGPEVIAFAGLRHFFQVDTGVSPPTLFVTVSGRMDSLMLGGFVDYETTVPVQATGDDDPYVGEILVTGADGSTVRIIINDSTSVTLEVDTNGDGVVDDYIDTNFAALNGNTSTINSSTAPVIAREAIHVVTGFGSLAVSPGAQFMAEGPFGQVQAQAVFGDFGPVDVDCAVAGTAAVSGTVANAGTYAANDLLQAAFAGCSRGGEVLDGELDLAIASYDGTPGDAYQVAGAVTEINLVRDAAGHSYTGAGELDMSYDFRFSAPGVTTLSASSQDFTLSFDDFDRYLSGVSVYAEIILGPPPVTISRFSSGSFLSFVAGGGFEYQSIEADVFLFDADPATGPFDGRLLVTASDGSRLMIIAVDELNVRLEVDYDGDSIPERAIDTTWAALQ